MTSPHHRSAFSRRSFVGGAAALAGAVLYGSATPAPGAAQETSPTPAYGGTIIIGGGAASPHLIPSVNASSVYIGATVPFYSGLTAPGPDFSPQPDLAEGWTVSDDGLVFIFNLRPNVTFHDGAPFTAADVKFTWELIADPLNVTAVQLYDFFSNIDGAVAYHNGEADEITGIRIVDDLTLEVTLIAPWAPFLTIGTAQYILPAHILADVPADQIVSHSFARQPVGTGPFVFQEWEADNFIRSTAFENYWRGRPYADVLIQRALTLDNNTTIPALESNDVNVAALSLTVIDSLPAEPSVQVRQRAGLANQYVEFNLAKPKLQDVRVRKALSYAINRQQIVDTVWQGRAQIYNSVFPYDWWATKQDTTLFDNDVEQAKALLDEAGWVVGEDGIREKDGEKLSFVFHAIVQDWSLIVQQQWRDIGVDAIFEFTQWATFSEQFYFKGEFEVFGMNVPYSLYADPHYALPGYFHSQGNRNEYRNPLSDELIDQAASSYDVEERKASYYEWQEVIAQDLPHLWIANPNIAWAYSPGLVVPERSGSHWELREIYSWFWAAE